MLIFLDKFITSFLPDLLLFYTYCYWLTHIFFVFSRMIEFVATQRLADLFGVSTAKNHKVDVLSKQTVTVEVMRKYIIIFFLT